MEAQGKVFLYARVSSRRQEQEETIQSQLEELRDRARQDGVEVWHEFIDEHYSRDDLVRPSLDMLRDTIGAGEGRTAYVQSPDRLASGAKLIILAEEFKEHGVELVFLRGSVEDTPEGKLLLHMQGTFAEYEREKIVERTRRGRLYWARQGALMGFLSPYGYTFVRRSDTQRAHLVLDEYQTLVVREMSRWLVEEHLSTRAIAKRLTEMGVPTARGAAQWQPTAVAKILRNPVYKGTFVYQRNQSVEPSTPTSTEPYRKNRKTGRKPRPRDEWIVIRVPAIVDEATWEAAQSQLKDNSSRSRRNNKKHRYLLRTLVRCNTCGGAYTGHVQHGLRRYVCSHIDPVISSTGKKCRARSVSADLLEEVVWDAVVGTLQNPYVLKEEYKRRMAETASSSGVEMERRQAILALRRVKDSGGQGNGGLHQRGDGLGAVQDGDGHAGGSSRPVGEGAEGNGPSRKG